MGNFWLKVKIWTKGILFGAFVIYALLFIIKNNEPAQFWWWFGHEQNTSKLVLIGVTFVAGILATILIRTTFSTINQVRELRERTRIEKLERAQAEIRVKAAMLQKRTSDPRAADVPYDPPSTI